MKQYGKQAKRWQIEVEFHAPLYTVQQKVSTAYGTLTPTPTGVLYRTEYEDLEGMAAYLMGRGLPFVVCQPPELREAFLRLAERATQIATGQP
jgi:predicted DNA-binding transcriptional regulator YafY